MGSGGLADGAVLFEHLAAPCDPFHVIKRDGDQSGCSVDEDHDRLNELLCAEGAVPKRSTDAWTCGEDLFPAAGFGLVAAGVQLAASLDDVQARVVASCAVGSAIRAIANDGSVLCQSFEATPASACPEGMAVIGIRSGGAIDCGFAERRALRGVPRGFNINYHTRLTSSNSSRISAALGADGRVVASFADEDELKVLRCADVVCISSRVTTVATAGAVGATSIAINTFGDPTIAYYDAVARDLRYLVCGDRACSTTSSDVVVDAAGDVGSFVSLGTASNGLPMIAYYDASNGDLRFALCGHWRCDDGNVFSTVASSLDIGTHVALAMGVDGMPVMVYRSESESRMELAHCEDLSCSGLVNRYDLQRDADYVAMTVKQDGYPLVAYHERAGDNLEYLFCHDRTCFSRTQQVLDGGTDKGGFASIGVAPDGMPIVSYYDGAEGALRVARCWAMECDTGERLRVRTVDDNGDPGYWTALVIGVDDVPLVVYEDDASGDIRTIHLSNPAVVPFFSQR